ncbi:HDOD domain-containing protein [Chromatiaceae bacterium AAb-1]|nr:HDOD domain-containing protein [Chromatiaceae bacterium AAb-1]
MSYSYPEAEELTQQFFDYLIGVTPGSKRLSYKLHAGNSATTERKLLAVETRARQLRLAGQQAREQLSEFAQAHLHELVADELFRRLSNIEQIMASVFQPGAEFYPVLDLLSLRGVTVNKLDPLISKVVWLRDDLLRLVNQPQYRNRTPSGSMVKDIKTALRFLGVESLQLIVPVYLMRRSIPHSSEPFSGLKDKLWDYSLATAIAARRLAEEQGEHPYNAFCAGLFHTLGHLVVTRNYLRT